jgi:signal transduction histidine kinase/ActR/RegA family two-component response regulator
MGAALFAREGWPSAVCPDFHALLHELSGIPGAVLLAEEALSAERMPQLTAWLSAQPEWSDLPIILLTSGSSRSRDPLELFGGHGNVSLLERPIQMVTLLSTMRSALRARRRQYQVRDLLEQREQARQEALEANQTKDQFLAALSHELRTPLTPVLLTVAALQQQDGLEDAVIEDLALIHRNVELEAKLIDDLLDLTRITHGKLILHRQVADVHELLRHTVQMCCGPDVLPKKLCINVSAEAAEHHALCDPPRIQQVLWNLLKNAVKFTPEHGRVTIASENPAPGTLRISISDTGIGVAPEVMPQIFDAFAQGDSRITKHFGGLGLGLAISKAIVDLHRGSLVVSSSGQGQGATFTLTLQAVEAPAPARVDGHRIDGTPVLPFRILLVEDNEPTLHILTRLLTRAGHEVHGAGSVASALRLAREYPFDLLVSDLGLPDGTGLELMEQLRRERPITGIALSGYGMEEDLESTAAAGFHTHLTKPVEWSSLEDALRRARAESADRARPLGT